MATLNKVQIIGRLGQDPELRHTKKMTNQEPAKAVCNFSVATTFKTRDTEHTEWHRVQAWENLADICSKLLRKGHLVYVEGRITTRVWEDKEGKKNYTTEIVASNVQKLTPKDDGAGSSGGPTAPPPGGDSTNQEVSLDEIPF